MQTDPVRAIRMAAALNQRYGALLRQRTGDSLDALELKIGESQQIYPEIWRYMDEARDALAQRGIVVESYDQIRATEEPGQLAVTDVEVEEGFDTVGLLVGGRPAYYAKKTATFNVGGYRKAEVAVRELKSAMPEVDWAGLERAEQQEIEAVGSLTAANWKKLGISIATFGGLFLVVLLIYKLVM